jgi:hypothetical protein
MLEYRDIVPDFPANNELGIEVALFSGLNG